MDECFFNEYLFNEYFFNESITGTEDRTKLAYRGRLNSMNKWPMMNRQLGGVSEQGTLLCVINCQCMC